VFQASTVRKNATNLRKVFRHVHPMALYIPLYGSLWCLGVASDSANPRAMNVETIASRMSERRIGGLKYYNAPLHGALFTLPNFVLDLTDGEKSARPTRIKAVA
jgi:spermidine synthase